MPPKRTGTDAISRRIYSAFAEYPAAFFFFPSPLGEKERKSRRGEHYARARRLSALLSLATREADPIREAYVSFEVSSYSHVGRRNEPT